MQLNHVFRSEAKLGPRQKFQMQNRSLTNMKNNLTASTRRIRVLFLLLRFKDFLIYVDAIPFYLSLALIFVV